MSPPTKRGMAMIIILYVGCFAGHITMFLEFEKLVALQPLLDMFERAIVLLERNMEQGRRVRSLT